MGTRTLFLISSGLLLAILHGWSVAAPLPPAGRPKEIASFEGDGFRVSGLAFSPDGKTLVSTGHLGKIKFWSVADWKNLADIKSHSADRGGARGTVRSVAFSPDSKTVATYCDDRMIRLWEVPTGRRVDLIVNAPLEYYPLLFSPDGKTLVCGSFRTSLGGKKWRPILEQPQGIVQMAAFDPKGKLLLTSIQNNWRAAPCIWLWDTEAGKITATCKGQTKHGGCIAFRRDGKVVAATNYDHNVRLWDVATGELKATFKDCPGRHCTLVFSPDGKILAVGYKHQEADGRNDARPQRGSVRLYEAGTGRVLATLEGDPGPIGPLAFSPNGQLLASGSFNGIITIWELPARYAAEKEGKK